MRVISRDLKGEPAQEKPLLLWNCVPGQRSSGDYRKPRNGQLVRKACNVGPNMILERLNIDPLPDRLDPDVIMQEFLDECENRGLTVTTSGIEDYLSDESRFRGQAWGLIRARSEKTVVEALRLANKWKVPLTVAASRTSITGAPVPQGGVVLDVAGLDRLNDEDPSSVGPGVILKRYKDLVESMGLFYPPDPTSEGACSIGGTIACNASGALSYRYGPTRDHILGLMMALPTGDTLVLNRGDVAAQHGVFRVPRRLISPQPAEDRTIPAPAIESLPWHECKNSAGLYGAPDMDLVDLFIGSEGILGVILDARVRLLPARDPFFGLMIYLPTRALTVELVNLLQITAEKDARNQAARAVRDSVERLSGGSAPDEGLVGEIQSIGPSCMEWFGASTARFLSASRASKLTGKYGCLYVEQDYPPGEDPTAIASKWLKLIELVDSARPEGSPAVESEAALDAAKIRELRNERVAVPEKLNESVRPGMRKIGSDFAVPKKRLSDVLEMYDRRLRHLDHYTFGHIGNANLHVNVLPRDPEEVEECHSLFRDMAREICALGGSVSAEHGTGKLKREYLELMLGKSGVADILRIKKALDPNMILNRGNMAAF